MKTKFNPFLAIIIALLAFSGCKSNVQKAEALIKDYMFKTLYDFDSYEVVETTIDSAFNNPIMNSRILSLAMDAIEKDEESENHHDEYEHASRSMDIWSGGWSSTSIREFNKAREKAIEELLSSVEAKRVYYQDLQQIKAMSDTLSRGHIGWTVSHRFRCNTKGGNKTLGDYIFIMDKKFKKILHSFDSEDEDFKSAFETIETANLFTNADLQNFIEKYDENVSKLKETLNGSK